MLALGGFMGGYVGKIDVAQTTGKDSGKRLYEFKLPSGASVYLTEEAARALHRKLGILLPPKCIDKRDCPTCGALKGDPCIGKTRILRDAHYKRKDKYNRE